MKRRKNRIKRLFNDVGVDFEDEGGIENMVLDYFHQLFGESPNSSDFVINHIVLCVFTAINSTFFHRSRLRNSKGMCFR